MDDRFAVTLRVVPSSASYPSLERKPGKQNWVDEAGGLPSYIERIAKHLHYEKGHTISSAIAMAVNTVKRWSTGTNHNGGKLSAATIAKAAKAVAEWTKKKASAKAKKLDESVIMTPEERGELAGIFAARLTMCEGMMMSLSGGRDGAVRSTRELLEAAHDAKPSIKLATGGPPADPRQLAEAKVDLEAEIQILEALVEGLSLEEADSRHDHATAAQGSSAKCAHCGHRMPENVKKGRKRCPKCGKTVSAEDIQEAGASEELVEAHVDEKLWQRCKSEAVKKAGKHSAYAMAQANKLYRDRGGKYTGDNPDDLNEAAKRVEEAARRGAKPPAKSGGMKDSNALVGATQKQGQDDADTSGPNRVGALQRRLTGLGHDVVDDGVFGPKTDAAVKDFQTHSGLKPDGVVGPTTTRYLQMAPPPDVIAAAEAEDDNPTPVGSPPVTPGAAATPRAPGSGAAAPGASLAFQPSDSPVLAKGMGVGETPNSHVGVMQGKLNMAGQNLEQDGVFGPKTEGGLKRFQKKWGLKTDGLAGPRTQTALDGAAAAVDKLREAVEQRQAANAAGDAWAFTSALSRERTLRSALEEADLGMLSMAIPAILPGATVAGAMLGVRAQKKKLKADPKGKFSVGDRVHHARLGTGTIKHFDSLSSEPMVHFDGGEKYLMPHHDLSLKQIEQRRAAGKASGIARHAVALAEASTRGEARKSLVKLKRLPNGTFAPKGRGQVLEPGTKVELPSGATGKVSVVRDGYARISSETPKSGGDGELGLIRLPGNSDGAGADRPTYPPPPPQSPGTGPMAGQPFSLQANSENLSLKDMSFGTVIAMNDGKTYRLHKETGNPAPGGQGNWLIMKPVDANGVVNGKAKPIHPMMAPPQMSPVEAPGSASPGGDVPDVDTAPSLMDQLSDSVTKAKAGELPAQKKAGAGAVSINPKTGPSEEQKQQFGKEMFGSGKKPEGMKSANASRSAANTGHSDDAAFARHQKEHPPEPAAKPKAKSEPHTIDSIGASSSTDKDKKTTGPRTIDNTPPPFQNSKAAHSDDAAHDKADPEHATAKPKPYQNAKSSHSDDAKPKLTPEGAEMKASHSDDDAFAEHEKKGMKAANAEPKTVDSIGKPSTSPKSTANDGPRTIDNPEPREPQGIAGANAETKGQIPTTDKGEGSAFPATDSENYEDELWDYGARHLGDPEGEKYGDQLGAAVEDFEPQDDDDEQRFKGVLNKLKSKVDDDDAFNEDFESGIASAENAGDDEPDEPDAPSAALQSYMAAGGKDPAVIQMLKKAAQAEEQNQKP